MKWARRRCLWGAACRDEAPRKPALITDSLSRRQPEVCGPRNHPLCARRAGPQAPALERGGGRSLEGAAGGGPGAGVFGGVPAGSGENSLAKRLE